MPGLAAAIPPHSLLCLRIPSIFSRTNARRACRSFLRAPQKCVWYAFEVVNEPPTPTPDRDLSAGRSSLPGNSRLSSVGFATPRGGTAGLTGTRRRCCVGTAAANGAAASLVMSAPVHCGARCRAAEASPHLSSAVAPAGWGPSRASDSVSPPAPLASRSRAPKGSPPTPPAAWIAAANPLKPPFSSFGSSFVAASPSTYTAHLLRRWASGTTGFVDVGSDRLAGAGSSDLSPGFSLLASS